MTDVTMLALVRNTGGPAIARRSSPFSRCSLVLCLFLILAICCSSLHAQIVLNDQWKYTTEKPSEDWMLPTFQDAMWKSGPGGFGTRGTPNARVATKWTTPALWLRKVVEVESIPKELALWMYHDEDAEVYLNGTKIASVRGYITEYRSFPVQERSLLKKGSNLLAVHCRQTSGGQFIDVHLMDANSPPKLPPPVQSTLPFVTELNTPWSESVDPKSPWSEYPRPQLKRETWVNLNGMWSYAISPVSQDKPPSNWDGEIVVPYCLESKLGRVKRLLQSNEALWYKRSFRLDSPLADRTTLIHFEAVDYECMVWVNGKLAGTHRGGNTPFTIDAGEYAVSGDNELMVRVVDQTVGWQLHGKQQIDPQGIWYTRVSGIWQSVWAESVPKRYIDDLNYSTDASKGSISIRPEIQGAAKSELTCKVIVREGSVEVATYQGALDSIILNVPKAKLWSPDSPFLYDITFHLLDSKGIVVDRVESYIGIRSVGKVMDAAGHWRLTLNGKVLFHWGPLDQGWWPDGLLTPPSDEAMLSDIQYLKESGFNMIRKHIKVEPRRYYYHCDRLGMMVWQDQVSASHGPRWTRLDQNPSDAAWSDQNHDQFMLELERMVDHLESHPSIVMWVPFNEAWGQHRTVEVGNWMVQRDRSRITNIASGGNFWPVGDVADEHAYPDPAFPFDATRYKDYIKIVGEFGGHGLPVPNHLWDPEAVNWGYGDLPRTESEFKSRYARSIQKLLELKKLGIAAGVYTQTTDVEGEINGLITYDRKVKKMSPPELRALHAPLTAE